MSFGIQWNQNSKNDNHTFITMAPFQLFLICRQLVVMKCISLLYRLLIFFLFDNYVQLFSMCKRSKVMKDRYYGSLYMPSNIQVVKFHIRHPRFKNPTSKLSKIRHRSRLKFDIRSRVVKIRRPSCKNLDKNKWTGLDDSLYYRRFFEYFCEQ